MRTNRREFLRWSAGAGARSRMVAGFVRRATGFEAVPPK
jgi:hypothetical protein